MSKNKERRLMNIMNTIYIYGAIMGGVVGMIVGAIIKKGKGAIIGAIGFFAFWKYSLGGY